MIPKRPSISLPNGATGTCPQEATRSTATAGAIPFREESIPLGTPDAPGEPSSGKRRGIRNSERRWGRNLLRFPEQEIEAHAEHIGNLHQPVQIRGGLSGFPFGDGLARYPRKLCQILLRETHCLAACLYFSADIEMLSRHRASIPFPADKFKPMRGRGAAGISRLVADSSNQTSLH